MTVRPAAVRIRDAVQEDIPAVSRLLAETWHDTYDVLLGAARVAEITRRWHALDVLAAQLGVRGTAFLVAETEDTLAGHGLAMWRDGHLHLARLYVAPKCQRRGVGRQLLAALADRFPGATGIRLEVEKGNVKGVGFYRQAGFTATGESVDDGAVILAMEKRLA
ncbi:N-acetyltransferase family protein [Ferrovibrio sp.]|uniref:GNAT family N-acetyltransferase n=1 Tax=Ferrovibrio sp. TaxID=1917215 RepID=UPI003519CF4B